MVKVVGEREVFGLFFHKAKDNSDCTLLEEEFLEQFKIANDALVESLKLLGYCGFGVGLRPESLVLFKKVISILCAVVRGCLL